MLFSNIVLFDEICSKFLDNLQIPVVNWFDLKMSVSLNPTYPGLEWPTLQVFIGSASHNEHTSDI